MAVAVMLVVPLLQAIGGAETLMPNGQPGTTWIVEVAVLSAVLSPKTDVPAAQVVPLPKLIWPLKVWGPVTATPRTLSVITVVDWAGITNEVLQNLN